MSPAPRLACPSSEQQGQGGGLAAEQRGRQDHPGGERVHTDARSSVLRPCRDRQDALVGRSRPLGADQRRVGWSGWVGMSPHVGGGCRARGPRRAPSTAPGPWEFSGMCQHSVRKP